MGQPIALNLLLGLPLIWGVCLTTLDVFGILYLQNKSFRWIEALVVTLIFSILACFVAEIWFCKPDPVAVLTGFIPRTEISRTRRCSYVAIGILGATVMPHNLYLHSSIIQTRKYELTPDGKREAIRFAIWDSVIALTTALLVNAAILIVAAARSTARATTTSPTSRTPTRCSRPCSASVWRARSSRWGAARLGPELDAHRHGSRARS